MKKGGSGKLPRPPRLSTLGEYREFEGGGWGQALLFNMGLLTLPLYGPMHQFILPFIKCKFD